MADTYTKAERQQIAQNIWEQMGAGWLRAMIDASWVMAGEVNGKPYLQFDFKGSRKHNKCRVLLDTATDLYTLKLYKLDRRTGDCPCTSSMSEVHGNMLVTVFEQETGLYLRM